MAEAHPVGFRWVMKAKERGATIIHVDPRFSRTSATADVWVPIRAGADIAFLGGLVREVLERDAFFRDYVVHYTNASVILKEDFEDTEELDGLFSGWDAEKGVYDPTSWRYEGDDTDRPLRDLTLQHPRCVFQVLKRHFARYTPALVERVAGVPPHLFQRVADALIGASGPDRTAAICYAVGWTQHSKGVQVIRTAAILQLLLGNIGRPGGGILALRGHASIQGSTDIPTLYDILPGYLPMPQPGERLDEYCARAGRRSGYWSNFRRFIVSLLKAWYGERATAENDFGFGWLPRITRNHSHFGYFTEMADGKVDGLFVMGQNPAVGGQHSRLERKALSKLEWLVVRDMVEIETANFWYESPEIETGELKTSDIETEVFLFPAAGHAEKAGAFTNTQRMLQWREKAVEPPGDARSEGWFVHELWKRLVAKAREEQEAANATHPRVLSEHSSERVARSPNAPSDALLALDWWYPEDAHGEPEMEAVLAEINGWRTRPGAAPDADAHFHGGAHEGLGRSGANDGPNSHGLVDGNGRDGSAHHGSQLSGFAELRDDGSTACGCWIYSGVLGPDGVNKALRREPTGPYGHGWGFAWPMDRRILYNRASARPDGAPWSERKALVWWDEATARWTGHDVPDFEVDKLPGYRPPTGATGMAAIPGDAPFIMHDDGLGWLFVPEGLKDGPLPAHYEPLESPVANSVYGQQSNPAANPFSRSDNPFAEPQDARFPHVLTTYRLTEHHTAGGMSRFLSRLAELQPEMFAEISPELAGEVGVENGELVTLVTPRGAVEARALVTRRMRPLVVEGRTVHQVALPFHWGSAGPIKGDAANDLIPFSGEPNVSIHEAKALT
jgi:formate dehydrogenase major subunit